MQDNVTTLRAAGYVENTCLGPITSLVTTACFTRVVPFTAPTVSASGGEVSGEAGNCCLVSLFLIVL